MITKQTIFSCAELADSIRTFLTADTLLLDIETTGLSAARHFIYCIGCSYLSPDKSDNITVQLFFAEKQEQEAELLAALYQSQLAKKSQDNFLNPDRYYINLVKKIISEGQKKGEIRTDISVEELAHDVLVLERGIIMDWCVQNGSFSLGYYGSRSFDLYIEFMRVG